LSDSKLKGAIGLRSSVLRQLLERMELYLEHDEPLVPGANRGLGINNLLFMSTELLLLGAMKEPYLPLLLIEEPEAHLHPQLQLLLIDYLSAKSKKSPDDPPEKVQVILTCHSPNLASKVELQRLIVMRGGHAFRMGPEFTLLDVSDYNFLRRFLDVTRAALFFARGLLIVEGDAEQLLLPTIANLLGFPLPKSGVTIINVGHVGLFRYMRIFQRRHAPEMPVRVACLVDRDIPPAEARSYISDKRKTSDQMDEAEIAAQLKRKQRHDGGPVRTYVSPVWTLEYDLAISGLAPYVAAAVALAKMSDDRGSAYDSATVRELLRKHETDCSERLESGTTKSELASSIYEDLHFGRASKAEAAQYLAWLLEMHPPEDLGAILPAYLIDAIEYASGADGKAQDAV
jgi:putative ATP-dependent endonuclease of the OLD family